VEGLGSWHLCGGGLKRCTYCADTSKQQAAEAGVKYSQKRCSEVNHKRTNLKAFDSHAKSCLILATRNGAVRCRPELRVSG
jgi:hypothetical protein